MIKLNNKNITYVALADTNNSVKGVKEVWYADTNNSVKLVYRRKDALIEGEDYEKYHWLEGDGSAYIDTLIYDLTGISIYCKLERNAEITDWTTTRILGREGDSRFIVTYANNSYTTNITLWTQNRSYAPLFTTTEGWIRINLEDNLVETNQSSESIETYTIKSSSLSIILFGDRLSTTTVSRIYKGKIGQLTVNQSMNLIPCKLLKPVPKWLDANGIRRNVGECGMIDLISGKFYGNVNSVGTFTVENYYERKEWLVGDGNAYIDTLIIEVNQNIIALNAIVDDSINGQALFGAEDITVSPTKRVFVRYNQNNSKKLIIYDSSPSRQVATDTIVNLIFSNDGNVYLNGDEVTTYNPPLSLTDSILLFAAFLRNSNGTSIKNSTNMKVSHFSISDRINLIPCTLTMDLPASMDANNIARTKGTSGMWDLVSDRFYGNVASSGTFKAVNLAEGVDYEIHQWLKGDGMARISTNETISSTDKVECVIKPTAAIETSGIWQYVYCNNSGDNDFTFMLVLDNPTSMYFRHYRTVSVYTPNNIYTIEHSINSVSVNGTQLEHRTENQYVETDRKLGLFYSDDNPYAGSTHIYTGYIGEFKLIDKLSLTPCRLLRSIPSKYDANGIARQAGECGMYDTVNDVFYGNVASSGAFSVSDDS